MTEHYLHLGMGGCAAAMLLERVVVEKLTAAMGEERRLPPPVPHRKNMVRGK